MIEDRMPDLGDDRIEKARADTVFIRDLIGKLLREVGIEGWSIVSSRRKAGFAIELTKPERLAGINLVLPDDSIPFYPDRSRPLLYRASIYNGDDAVECFLADDGDEWRKQAARAFVMMTISRRVDAYLHERRNAEAAARFAAAIDASPQDG